VQRVLHRIEDGLMLGKDGIEGDVLRDALEGDMGNGFVNKASGWIGGLIYGGSAMWLRSF
jgi:hypothetical protein